MPKSKWN